MEREMEYRRRLHDVAASVKRRLDYQAQLESLQRQFEQRQLVSWLENQVLQTVKSRPVSIIVCLSVRPSVCLSVCLSVCIGDVLITLFVPPG